MPLNEEIRGLIFTYCRNHLADNSWYDKQLEFIEDDDLKRRIIREFMAIRFAYKLYEGIQAKKENYIFQIRYQIFAYASLYEAILDYVLLNCYKENRHFKNMLYYKKLKKISVPKNKMSIFDEIEHDGKKIFPCYEGMKKNDYSKIKFESKCDVARRIGLIYKIKYRKGKECDLPNDILRIYNIRNGIHLYAEKRKGIEYDIELSKVAYRRMKPFLEQIKLKLKKDKKI